MIYFRAVVFILLFANVFTQAQTIFVPFETVWKYYDLGHEPIDQSSFSWTDSAYVDSAWSVGPAQLGYGEGDENTLILSSTLTGYFRHSFSILNANSFDSLNLQLLYDDGAVVYLNEVEIWRVNMPAGAVSYDTFASSNPGNNALAATTKGSNLLKTGENVLAVELHQRSAASSDISFDFQLIGNIFGDIELVRGPYLQKGHANGMTIMWRTSDSTISALEYGEQIDSFSYTVVDSALKINHEIQLQNLDAETRYYYRLNSHLGALVSGAEDLYFQTSPTIGTTQFLRAWILGDPGTGNNNARNVRDAYYNYVDSQHTDMVLFLGDNAYVDGTDEEYQTAVFENMYEHKLKNSVAWSTLGNHDGHSADSETQTGPYYEIFSLPTNAECGGMASGTEAYYSFDYGNVHFIILDSYDSDRSIDGPMHNWCLSDLQNTLADWIVAIWHHPAYSKGSHDSDTEGRLKTMRTNFLPILEDYGVDVILSGHSHSYERSYFINGHYDISDSFDVVQHTVGGNGDGDGRIAGDGAYGKTYCEDEGAVYVTAGSSGKTSSADLDHEAMFISVSELGSCVMEVDGSEMKFKFIRENGIVRDSFSIIKTECDTSSFTVCASISSVYGDVEERPNGSIYETSSDLEMAWDNTINQKIGLVFDNIQVRRGSAIQSAYVQFMSDLQANDVSADSCVLTIEGFNFDHAELFTEDLYDVSSRPNTVHHVVWKPIAWNVPGEISSLQRTPDLSSIIQEIINRPGFKDGNNIGFKITGVGKRSAVSFDRGTPGIPAELCINYSACVDSLDINQINNNGPTFAAQRTIHADAVLQAGELINFTAGHSITLEGDFQVDLGREFSAFILGCILR